jgi:hypothetical protein
VNDGDGVGCTDGVVSVDDVGFVGGIFVVSVVSVGLGAIFGVGMVVL